MLLRCHPGADRDEQEPVDTGGPAQPVLGQRRLEEELERRVVERCDATIDEHLAVLGFRAEEDLLCREEGRRGRAGPDHLPERRLAVVVLAGRIVVLRGRVGAQRPRGVGLGVVEHGEEQRLAGGAEGGVLAELVLEHLGEAGGRVLVAEPGEHPVPAQFDERLATGLAVQVLHRGDGHPGGHARRDDGAGAGSGHIVEVVAEDEVGAGAELAAQHVLHAGEHFERQDPADPAPVQCQQLALRRRHGGHRVPSLRHRIRWA